ncbi:MAG: ABC transporter substrate-binding protein [Chloroflexota bacterium]
MSPSNRVSRRMVMLRPLLAAGVLPLIACDGLGGTEHTTGAAGATGEPVTVTFMSRTAEEEAFTKRVAEFQGEYPRIRLDYQPLSGNYLEVVRTNAAAGTLADVVYMSNLLFEGLAVGGSIQPLDPLVRRDKLNLKQWYDKGVESLRLDGKLFGLPARGQIAYCYLFYNRDAFQEAGLREPTDRWTLDNLVSAAETLTIRDGSRHGIGIQWGNFQQTTAAIRRFGGELLSADGKTCLADSPQALASMQWHWDLWHRRQVMAVKTVSNGDFGNGKVAMAGQKLAGARGGIKNAVKESFAWSIALMPKGPAGKHGAILSVALIGLKADTRVADQGWEVVKWFTNKDTGIELGLQTRGSNTPGMRRDVYCDERMLSDPRHAREVMERICKAMDLASTVTYSVPANFRQPEVDEVVQKHMHAFRENTATPSAAAMRAFAAELQAVLDRPRAGG